MEYKLWENNVPEFDASIDQPEPSLTPFLVSNDKNEKRGCIIVAPGGGYSCRSDQEGAPIAEMINEAGINAFVLNYRVAPYRYPVQLYDINRAVRYVRYHADKFGIDGNKIGIMGFSAGGHLCTMGIEHFDYGRDDGDEIDRVSSRPDVGVLCYPVVSFLSYMNEGSRTNLFGTDFNPELTHKLSGEINVRDDTPPVFMWHTSYDTYVPVENSLNLALALRRKKIPFELHSFAQGEHGLGLSESIPSTAQWCTLLKKWLLDQGF